MNCFNFEELKVGTEVSFDYELNEEKMSSFLKITGDKNPLHCDLKYANEKGFSEKVVYGMLTASILSTLAGMYLPGKYSLIHSVEINFIKPVFLSSSPLKIIAEVIEKDNRFYQIKLKYVIINKLNEKVCRGIMKIGFVK